MAGGSKLCGWTVSLAILLGANAPALPGHFAPADAQFARDAALFFRAQIDASKLVLRRSQDDDARRLAQRVINDDMALSHDLRALMEARAEAYGQPLPAPELDAFKRLKEAKNDAFDARYTHWQAQTLLHATGSFALHVQRAADPILARWADDALSVLQRQQMRAERLADADIPAN